MCRPRVDSEAIVTQQPSDERRAEAAAARARSGGDNGQASGKVDCGSNRHKLNAGRASCWLCASPRPLSLSSIARLIRSLSCWRPRLTPSALRNTTNTAQPLVTAADPFHSAPQCPPPSQPCPHQRTSRADPPSGRAVEMRTARRDARAAARTGSQAVTASETAAAATETATSAAGTETGKDAEAAERRTEATGTGTETARDRATRTLALALAPARRTVRLTAPPVPPPDRPPLRPPLTTRSGIAAAASPTARRGSACVRSTRCSCRPSTLG